MIPALFEAITTAQAMKPREFHSAKSRAHPAIIYALHGDGRVRLLAVDRDYHPVGFGHEGFADYADPRFDDLRCDDTPAIRKLAAEINIAGRSNFPGGVRVPILVLLANGDSRESYCRRLRALIEELR